MAKKIVLTKNEIEYCDICLNWEKISYLERIGDKLYCELCYEKYLEDLRKACKHERNGFYTRFLAQALTLHCADCKLTKNYKIDSKQVIKWLNGEDLPKAFHEKNED